MPGATFDEERLKDLLKMWLLSKPSQKIVI